MVAGGAKPPGAVEEAPEWLDGRRKSKGGAKKAGVEDVDSVWAQNTQVRGWGADGNELAGDESGGKGSSRRARVDRKKKENKEARKSARHRGISQEAGETAPGRTMQDTMQESSASSESSPSLALPRGRSKEVSRVICFAQCEKVVTLAVWREREGRLGSGVTRAKIMGLASGLIMGLACSTLVA